MLFYTQKMSDRKLGCPGTRRDVIRKEVWLESGRSTKEREGQSRKQPVELAAAHLTALLVMEADHHDVQHWTPRAAASSRTEIGIPFGLSLHWGADTVTALRQEAVYCGARSASFCRQRETGRPSKLAVWLSLSMLPDSEHAQQRLWKQRRFSTHADWPRVATEDEKGTGGQPLGQTFVDQRVKNNSQAGGEIFKRRAYATRISSRGVGYFEIQTRQNEP